MKSFFMINGVKTLGFRTRALLLAALIFRGELLIHGTSMYFRIIFFLLADSVRWMLEVFRPPSKAFKGSYGLAKRKHYLGPYAISTGPFGLRPLPDINYPVEDSGIKLEARPPWPYAPYLEASILLMRTVHGPIPVSES